MSTNRPSNSSARRDSSSGNRPAGGSGQRPAGTQGQRPGGAPGQRPASNAPRQGAGGSGPARRPPTQAGNRVQVRPTRPQARQVPPPQSASRYVPYIIGGALVLVALILAATFLLGNNNTGTTGAAGTPGVGSSTPASGGATGAGAGGNSTAVVETSKGTFKIHLFTDDPSVTGTVKNFQDKASSGYFNGKIFHRVEDWVIQGGDPLGNGTGGGSMPGEYNQRAFKRGAVGMASTAGAGPTVNDSQWFVVKTDADYLNGQYSNFGQVTDGMDVVDKIAIGDTMTKITMQP